MNRTWMLFGALMLAMPLAAPANPIIWRNGSNSEPIVAHFPVFASPEKFTNTLGDPIRLHIRLENTFGHTIYYGYSGQLSDWSFTVKWHGMDGRSFQDAAMTPAGRKALAAPGFYLMNVNCSLAPGADREGPIAVISDLFDMKRRGDYDIQVSKRISLDQKWKSTQTISAPTIGLHVQ